MTSETWDVAVVGGGPAGSTLATILKKYAPDMRVLILEREKFPRDHVGESLLPVISQVLNEMGCWDLVEAANFPVKIGATYRWGTVEGLWDFDFLPAAVYEDKPRPGKYEGQRLQTAFQVDRSIYDKILLDYSRTMGADVREQAKVVEVKHEGDRVTGLKLADGQMVTARYYVDASGNSGVVRKALDVPSNEPSPLRNVAFWDYWQNAEWAVKIGVSGTRIQVMSLGWGWIWFIPLGPTRTSVGFVVPAEHYKKLGQKAEDLYLNALQSEPRISSLLKSATREGKFSSTRDWSFIADRTVGENWFLVGESAGFADPILSAGVSIAHATGKEAACTIMELDRGDLDAGWLRQEFDRRTKHRVNHHIRFADYWYRANTKFTDLVEFTSEIAKDAGLDLDGENAWQWLGTGGFIDDESGGTGLGTYNLAAIKAFVNEFSKVDLDWCIAKNNSFTLNLQGSEVVKFPHYEAGRVRQLRGYIRNGKTLPCTRLFSFLIYVLKRNDSIERILWHIDNEWCMQESALTPYSLFLLAAQGLEAMVNDGWVTGKRVDGIPLLNVDCLNDIPMFQKNTDNQYGAVPGEDE